MVNTPTTHGSIGLSTGLDPSMTLGCGGPGGNITSDNISPKHLLNIKRVAYELRPVTARAGRPAGGPAVAALPRAPERPVAGGLAAEAVQQQVTGLMSGRAAGADTQGVAPAAPAGTVADFVCEDDVKQAVRLGRKILIGDRTIVTPSARDLAEAHRVFQSAGWPR